MVSAQEMHTPLRTDNVWVFHGAVVCAGRGHFLLWFLYIYLGKEVIKLDLEESQELKR